MIFCNPDIFGRSLRIFWTEKIGNTGLKVDSTAFAFIISYICLAYASSIVIQNVSSEIEKIVSNSASISNQKSKSPPKTPLSVLSFQSFSSALTSIRLSVPSPSTTSSSGKIGQILELSFSASKSHSTKKVTWVRKNWIQSLIYCSLLLCNKKFFAEV